VHVCATDFKSETVTFERSTRLGLFPSLRPPPPTPPGWHFRPPIAEHDDFVDTSDGRELFPGGRRTSEERDTKPGDDSGQATSSDGARFPRSTSETYVQGIGVQPGSASPFLRCALVLRRNDEDPSAECPTQVFRELAS
jgi:hypothetical protein